MTIAAASNEERIGILEAGQKVLASDVLEIKSDIRDMRTDLAGRPTWAVTFLLGLLSSATVGLSVALATIAS